MTKLLVPRSLASTTLKHPELKLHIAHSKFFLYPTMIRTALFLLALALSSRVAAQSAAQPALHQEPTKPNTAKNEKMKGLLWEIAGNGMTRPGYLYGTMHVSEKLVFNLSDSFFIALRSVDDVALETDCERWQEFQEQLSSSREEMGGRYGSYRPRRSGINLYNGAFLFESPANDVLGGMLSFKPYLSNEFLYRSEEYRADYEENTYLDLFIHQAGKKLGKKVFGLETIDGSYEAVTRASLPPENDKDEERTYNRGYVSRDDFEGAYRDQDLSLLDSLDQLMTPSKHYRKWMLDERNIVMANGIDSVMRRGETIFAAVGAAHLPGDMGVIQLLRKKGYTMRAVKFNTVAEPAVKESIEKLHYPVKFNTQWAPDSSWSAEAPGKFYETVDAGGFTQHLFADMSNGAYYAVYSVKTNGFWTGQNPEYIAKRLDSLLYERVPGKIQERKRLDGPFPGHEITTRTRRGDILRYKVMVTPFDVLVFLIGGTGEYALGEEATRFLKSARIPQTSPRSEVRPTVVRPQHGGFTATFPATLLVNTTDQFNQLEQPDDFLAATIDPRDQAVYFLLRKEYHDWNFIEEDSFELNIIGEKIAEAYTKTPPQVKLISTKPYPTQDISFRADKDSAQIHLRLVIDGPIYYLLGTRSRNATPPTAFFESFALHAENYPEGWKEKRDTSVKFTVSIPNLPEKPIPAFVTRMQKLYQEAAERRGGYGDYGSNSRYKSAILQSPATGEKVQVGMYEMPEFTAFPTLDSLKISTKKDQSNNGKLVIRESSWQEINGMQVADFTLQDTNSNRGIKSKVFIVNRKTYTLTATVNLDEPESEFIRRMFSTFKPTDSVSADAPYGKRNLDFLKNIYSADSLQRKKALKELDIVYAPQFKTEDFEVVKAAIENPGFGKLKFTDRKNLIDLLGDIKSPQTVPYLLNFYQKSGDSVRYQAAVIDNLADIQTKESYKTLIRLLLEQPIQSDGYGQGIFSELRDSLELAATLYPDLLKLTAIDEFQDDIFDLLFLLRKNNLVKPRDYANQKDRLIQNASYRLTRYRMGWETDHEDGDEDENYSYTSSNSSSVLKRNLSLLSPFIRKDDKVKSLMERALSLGDKQLQLFVYGLYLQTGIPVASEQLKPFAEQQETQALVYGQLASAQQLANYPASWFKDTTSLLESYFFGKGGTRSNIDSVRLISRHKTRFRSGDAWLYFFDVKQKKNPDWILAYAYVPKDMAFLADSKDNGIVNNDSYNYRNRKYLRSRPEVQVMQSTTGKKKEEVMKKKIGAIRFENRERYFENSGGDYRPDIYDDF